MPIDPADLEQLHSLLAEGKKIEAIKVYRERTGARLAEAKDAVEALEA
jgi:ribosomal protein L7/L12